MSHTIRRPDDFHVHLRESAMLKLVAPHTAKSFARALIMPNTKKPILTGQDALHYKQAILSAGAMGDFEPLMTIKLVGSTTPETIQQAKELDVIAGKYYPEGVTTNSEDGVRDIKQLYPVFAAMETCGMVLCLHGESVGVFSMDREGHFLQDLKEVAFTFPQLRIVLEHVTTAAAVTVVRYGPPNIAATITVHHLVLTLDDIVGDKLNPHAFCKPIAKRPEDRDALLEAAMSGNPKFFLGTDSAPHSQKTKECASGCAGIFSAPVALAVLAQVFDTFEALDKLEAFTSEHGANFYGLPLNARMLTLSDDPWVVPEMYGPVVPFRAGHTLNWRVE